MDARFFPKRLARPNGTETDEKDENILVMERGWLDGYANQLGLQAVLIKYLPP